MILLLYLDDNTFISSLVDVTFVDVAHNKKTAIGIVNVNCIAFDPVPIVGVAAIGIDNVACIAFDPVPIVGVASYTPP